MKALSITTILFFSLLITSCNNSNQPNSPRVAASQFIDNLPGSCPNLTKDQYGNTVLSWVRETSDSTAIFCYAISTDGGKSFNAPVLIPVSDNVKPHAENLPKVIFKPSGEIIALWGAASNDPRKKYSGNIFYSQSFDEGKSWSAAKPLVTDTTGYDQRYFDVALLQNGEAGIIWLDNRKQTKEEGSALYFASTSGNNGFTGERRITDPCCQCCRTDLFIDSKNNLHILYRGIIQDSIRDMVHIVSTDGGRSFSSPKRISNDNWVLNACPHTGPAMTENGAGIHFAWYTGGKHKGTFYTRSTDYGSNFIGHDSVSYAGKHPQLTADAKGNLIIVWDEYVKKQDQVYSRVGVQYRTAEGKSLAKHFITPDTTNATYPVLTVNKQGETLVAFCLKKMSKNYVAYQLIRSNK
jgi:hypothetical protein